MMCHCSMTSPGDLKSRHTSSRSIAARGAPKWGNYHTVTQWFLLFRLHARRQVRKLRGPVSTCRYNLHCVGAGLLMLRDEIKKKVKYFIIAVRHHVECINISYQGIEKCPFPNFSKSCQPLSSMADSQFFYSSFKGTAESLFQHIDVKFQPFFLQHEHALFCR